MSPALAATFPRPEDVLQGMIDSAPGSATEHSAMQERGKKLMAFINQQKNDRGGKDITLVFTSNDEGSPGKAVTEGGLRFLALDPDAVKLALMSDKNMREHIGMVGHEFEHFFNKDVQRDRAEPKIKRRAELKADLGGAGPLGTKDPEATISMLMRYVTMAAEHYNAAHPDAKLDPDNLDKKGVKAISDWMGAKHPTHPAPLERIAALELEAQMLKEGLRKGEMPAQQSKRIVDEILKRAEEGTLPEASIMKAPDGVPVKTLGKLSGMMPLPMDSGDIHRVAFTPAAVKAVDGLKLSIL